ncbi:hypothetical protein DMB42_11865 [Nonomuraea sp. WAC 01424]|uniref:hypothetical protein n=1 Tax=Nonomuraea sp. WAC 01424 TaxID=2203200 RepID=UPI000F7B7239|nr:hypothetical protein [Nonomuraea sp. WAC 01424]RSN12867.1 hypothetical protein DMB42_11865 [Nonomuraea sp. WAC 01424]
MDYRVLYDVESARRTNFSDATKRAIEQAYQLKSGAVDRALQGGDLEPSETDRRTQPREAISDVESRYADRAEQHLWETPGLSATQRRQLIGHLQAMRRADEAHERHQSHAEVHEFRRRSQ